MIKIKETKIHALTQYSKAIIIPAFWIKSNKLESGDKLVIYLDNENNILIKPEKK